MSERWLPYSDTLLVSDKGRVKRDGKLLDFSKQTSKYPKVGRTAVHWMVLELFVGPRPDGLLALHKNDDPRDNRVDNLYWGTCADNARDRHRNRDAIAERMLARILTRKSDSRYVTIGFTVTKAEHEKLRKAADKDDRSLADKDDRSLADWVRRLALGAVKRGGGK